MFWFVSFVSLVYFFLPLHPPFLFRLNFRGNGMRAALGHAHPSCQEALFRQAFQLGNHTAHSSLR